MKKKISALFLMLMIAFGFSGVHADPNNHYVNGVEGVKGGSVPPPGFYYKMYNVFYSADETMDQDGNEAPIGFDLNIFAIANRFIWVTDKKFLGADFFMDTTIPLMKTDLEITALGVNSDDSGIGDICLEPAGLAWHGPRYDAALALAVYLPTGDFDITNPASNGKGFYTFMTTFGGTYYFDAQKTWSASFLGRYEIHTDQEDRDYTPGDDLHFEWGIGKSFAKVWEAGIAGYCQWQVSDDSGSNATDVGVHDQVYAIGPEISVFIPRFKLFANFRAEFEFEAEDRPQGNVFVLTLTKIF
ncbi:SphA family protein [Desulfospira joergensenii]|uniref:SphA family protein n=1 Tax=Desulfospira joergensenii TaxID=53329 RepID=UPI0003B5B0DE|nr:transporter [Desulfospira joergensenii]